MGKIDLEAVGLRGKIGPLVAYITKEGEQRYRGYSKPRDPKTAKQLAHRMKFGMVSRALAPLNREIKLVRWGERGAYRKVWSHALKNAVAGEYPNFRIDYGKIAMAEGNLSPVSQVSCSISEKGDELIFVWNPLPTEGGEQWSGNDRVNIVCLSQPLSRAKTFINVGKRADGRASVSTEGLVEGGTPRGLHFWIYLTNNSRAENSNSIYAECR